MARLEQRKTWKEGRPGQQNRPPVQAKKWQFLCAAFSYVKSKFHVERKLVKIFILV
jgi:hypothetical protein